MFFARDLPLEEVFVRFTFGPILGSDGKTVEGIFCPCTETTEQVVGARRLETLRRLGIRAVEAQTVESACRASAEVLADNPYDIPFAALYLTDETGARLTLRGSAGLPAFSFPLPAQVAVAVADGWASPFATVLRTQQAVKLDDLVGLNCQIHGPWSETVAEALVLPIGAAVHGTPLAGLLVVGVSPRRRLDPAYHTFFDLVAAGIGTTIADAQAYEAERKRVEALAEIDRAKTLFFTNISHEFRTPPDLDARPARGPFGKARGRRSAR